MHPIRTYLGNKNIFAHFGELAHAGKSGISQNSPTGHEDELATEGCVHRWRVYVVPENTRSPGSYMHKKMAERNAYLGHVKGEKCNARLHKLGIDGRDYDSRGHCGARYA